MGIGKRIKEARENLGLTQNELGELVGVTGSAITNYEKETSHPKENIMYKLLESLNVDANFLFQDVVNIPPAKNDITLAEFRHIQKYRALDDYGRETIDIILDREANRVKATKSRSVQSAKIIRLSYYQKLASAGTGEYVFDDIPIDTIEVPLDEISEKADFVIGVNGNSMEPTYYDGDKVFVERCQIVETGEIGVFMVNNECLIKEAGKDGLISHNKEYGVIPGTETIQCIGKVLGKVLVD